MSIEPAEDWFQKYGATRELVKNLEANIEGVADELDQETKDILMRVNLIMIRQCLLDFGIE